MTEGRKQAVTAMSHPIKCKQYMALGGSPQTTCGPKSKRREMTHASLFSGIGGPEVAAEMMGWENVFHCEINPFGKAILDYWFPNAKSYDDITKTDFTEWRGKVDILTGGFPCQPFSYAGKRGGSRTSDISGRRCSEQLKRFDLASSWARMLLVSPLWSKEGFSLTWEMKPLFSERWTEFTDTDSARPSPSNESAEIWRVADIPSNRCLYLLRLSEHPTEETESSFLLQIPTAVMTKESPERMQARAERNGYKNGTKYGSLESQICYDPKVQGLLRTPSAMDGKNWENSDYTGGGTLAQEIMQNPKYKEMLPTPTARDFKNPSEEGSARIARKQEQGWTIELNDMAAMRMLPTPRANKNVDMVLTGGTAARQKSNLEEEVARLLPTPTCNDAINQTLPKSQAMRNDSIVKRILTGEIESEVSSPNTDGKGFRLSPLFTEEMMGFPSMWTTLPFLSPDGGRNRSKPTGTQ